MALQKDIQLEVTYIATIALKNNSEMTVPLTLNSAYINVDNIKGGKESIIFTVNVYEDSSKSNLVMTKDYLFTPDTSSNSPNFIQQAYEHLKTLPEYSGAIDILEDGQTL